MKFFHLSADAYSFEFVRREKQMLFQVLGCYPLVPVAHHRLSRQPAPAGGQKPWLEDPRPPHRAEPRQKCGNS